MEEKKRSRKYVSRQRGFTLVELIVSISIFIVVMTVVMGTVLSVLNIYRKAQSEKTAMDNLDFALDSLSRSVRFGTNYHCGSTGQASSPRDCASGDTTLSVLSSSGNEITYSLSNGALMRSGSSSGNSGTVSMTSPEVTIQSLTFRVFGSASYASGDYLQPQVIVTIAGVAGPAGKPQDQSAFQVETTISQRKLDI